MGKRNYLIEGVSGTGKTSVAEELQRRGYHVLHGDRELKYRGVPKTGEPVNEPVHESERDKAVWQQEHHLWDIDKVKAQFLWEGTMKKQSNLFLLRWFEEFFKIHRFIGRRFCS